MLFIYLYHSDLYSDLWRSVVFCSLRGTKEVETFFSHTAGSMVSSVQGVFRSRDISEFSCFVAF